MTADFHPQLDALPRSQQQLWPELRATNSLGFVLYGGAAIASARALYGSAFQPSESLKALVYFEGGDLESLPEADRHTLIRAVSEVRRLPSVTIVSRSLRKPVEE
jgi:hypothetical protein